MKNITSAQVRAARAMMRWTAEQLATKSKLGVATIRRAEALDGPVQMTASNAAVLRQTLETAGIEFIFDSDEGVGVRLKRK